MKRAALGFRAHSGWAAMVALREPAAAPLVIQRRRVELAGSLPRQPYHAATEMRLDEAAAFIQECRVAATANAARALGSAVADLKDKGLEIAGAVVLAASGRPIPDLAATLASHPMVHTAEGQLYRDALKNACELRGLPVTLVKEKELPARLGLPMPDVERRLREMGEAIGPPWRQDEKLSAMAAWLLLLQAEDTHGILAADP